MDIVFVKDTCKLGQRADCCRYLTAGRKGFNCEKFSSLKDVLDKKVEANTMVAQGDNNSNEVSDYNIDNNDSFGSIK